MRKFIVLFAIMIGLGSLFAGYEVTADEREMKPSENAGSKALMFRGMPRRPKSFSITRM
jgi:hypothetical protein